MKKNLISKCEFKNEIRKWNNILFIWYNVLDGNPNKQITNLFLSEIKFILAILTKDAQISSTNITIISIKKKQKTKYFQYLSGIILIASIYHIRKNNNLKQINVLN